MTIPVIPGQLSLLGEGEVGPSVAQPEVKKRFVEVSFYGDVCLHEEDLWPDGDAPENWGAEDARKVIEHVGLRDMELLTYLEYDVTIIRS